MSHGSRRAADVVEDFFEARGADLLTFLRRRLRCDADAHDIAQETYLRFIRLGKPEQIQNAESYVFRIASNLLWEHRLREGPAQRSGNPTEEIADDCTALDLAASEERGARIRKVLDALPALPRAVLILHLRDGMTCPEIGTRIGNIGFDGEEAPESGRAALPPSTRGPQVRGGHMRGTGTDPGPDSIARAAADWVVRLRDPRLSASERAQFSEWIQESPVHVREYLAAAEVWGILRNAKAWPTDSAEELISAARQSSAVTTIRPDETTHGVQRPRARHARVRASAWFSAAAALVAALGTLTLLEHHAHSGDIDISTVRGEQRTLDLSDGTVARFNTLTRAVIHYDAHVRRIELTEGEAFFRVIHDPKRPFEVVTPFATVRDVGTAFDVYSSSRHTRIAVVEGEVRVTRAASQGGLAPQAGDSEGQGDGHVAVSLAANQVLIVAPGSAETPISNPGASTIATAWLGNRIILDNQRLDAAVAEFNRYNSIQLTLNASGIGALRISGVFDANDPQALVTYLERIRGLQITQSANRIFIGRQDP